MSLKQNIRIAFRKLQVATLLLLPLAAFGGISGADIQNISSTTDNGDVPLIGVGVVQEIDLENSTVVVNGQKIVVDLATELQSSDTTHYGYLSLGELKPADYIAVYGEVMDPGLSLATIITVVNSEYSQGASPAYIKAIVNDADASSATANSGSTVIDFSSSLHSMTDTELSGGDIVEFFGTAVDSLVSATYVRKTSGQSSSAVQAIRGSGVRAIRGSGVRAIRGSGVRAIRGSGVR